MTAKEKIQKFLGDYGLCLWQTRNGNGHLLTAYQVGKKIVIIQEYDESNFELFIQTDKTEVDEIIGEIEK